MDEVGVVGDLGRRQAAVVPVVRDECGLKRVGQSWVLSIDLADDPLAVGDLCVKDADPAVERYHFGARRFVLLSRCFDL